MTYGALSIPAYWLKDYTLSAFNSLLALWIVFNVVTFILGALLNIYIPYCMRQATISAEPEPVVTTTHLEARNQEKHSSHSTAFAIGHEEEQALDIKSSARKYGFAMSILGTLGNAFGACLMLGVTIILARYLTADAGQSAGLLVTTVMGFVTVLLGVPVYFGLPSLPTKTWPTRGRWRTALTELAMPYREMFLHRRNMMFLLIAYTVYSDTLFALYSLTSQLYFIEVQPDTFEYSLYTLSGNLFWALLTVVFYVVQLRFKWDLGKVLIIGYALILIIPIWGCIGLANIENFGLKVSAYSVPALIPQQQTLLVFRASTNHASQKRWEFYVQVLIFYGSQAIVNPTFRLLYAEFVPAGEEIMWFGLQVILSCATTWVNYVATAPLQNHTHNLRFPIVLCLVMLIVPLVLEYLRATMDMFKRESDVVEPGTMRDVDDSRMASESV